MAMNLSCTHLGLTYINDNAYNVSLLITAVLTSLLTIPTFTINLAIITVVIKKQIFHTPPFMIIANMAVSDLLCSCTTFILFPIHSVYIMSGHDPCIIANIGVSFGYLFCATSFTSILLQSIERYLAIFYPFWYHEKLTVRKLLLLDLISWLPSSFFVTLLMLTTNRQLFNGIFGAITLVLFIGTIAVYIRIYGEVKRIEKLTASQVVVSESNDKHLKTESKVTKATAIILFTFAMCFAPNILLSLSTSIIGKATYFTDLALYWIFFLTLSNSFLNPLVVCRQLTTLRRSVTDFLCFWKRPSQISP